MRFPMSDPSVLLPGETYRLRLSTLQNLPDLAALGIEDVGAIRDGHQPPPTAPIAPGCAGRNLKTPPRRHRRCRPLSRVFLLSHRPRDGVDPITSILPTTPVNSPTAKTRNTFRRAMIGPTWVLSILGPTGRDSIR